MEVAFHFTDFFEDRKSMATQRTHRELAPRYAAGKVPVPWGRKCHWETGRPWHSSHQRSTSGVVVLVFWSFAAAKSCRERLQERQLNGAHSFHALFQQMFGRGTLQTVFSGFAVEPGQQSRDRLCYTELKAGRACGCLYDDWIGSRFILAMTLEL